MFVQIWLIIEKDLISIKSLLIRVNCTLPETQIAYLLQVCFFLCQLGSYLVGFTFLCWGSSFGFCWLGEGRGSTSMGAFLCESALSFCLYILLAVATFKLMQKLLIHFFFLLFFYFSLLLLLHPRYNLKLLSLLDAFLVDGSFSHEFLHIPIDVLIDYVQVLEMSVLPYSALISKIFHQLHRLDSRLNVVWYLHSALIVVGSRNIGRCKCLLLLIEILKLLVYLA